MCEADETMRACAHSVNVLVGVLNVQCHASGEVRCSVVISVVIGICLIELSVPLLQFYMSVAMRGMGEPKVVHQLQVVRVARYVLQHAGEAWLFGYQANPKTLYVYTDTDWAADELTRKSVSCTVERYGSHMLD